MKTNRIIVGILSICLAFSSATLIVSADSVDEKLAGDINFDGIVDVTDLSELSLAIIGDTSLTEDQIKIVDFNENGKADITDLARMRQYLSYNVESLKYSEGIEKDKMAVPTESPVDGTDYSKVERDPEAIKSGFSGLREATEEEIAASKNQPDKDKMAVPTESPVDGTDYSKVERDPEAVKSGFSGGREATEEQIAASKNQPDKDKMAVPTDSPVDGTDYSKVERDPEAVKSGFSGGREATEEQIAASKNQPDKDKMAVPTESPVDGTDYSKVERDPEAVKSGFSGGREATEEQIAASKNQPDKDKMAVPTDSPVDGTDYSKIERDPEAVKSGFSGGREATEEQIAASKNQPDKDKMTIKKSRTRSTWNPLSDMSSFYYYPQEKNYSCGAACVRMALRYLTGVNYPEDTVRTGCGTTTSGTYLSYMQTYINSEQTANYYATRFGVDKPTMKTNLYNGIVNWDAPPIVGLQETTSNGWPFDLGAHFVAIYSIKDDKSEVAIADPWGGYISSSSPYRWYDVSTDDVYTAYNAIDCGYMF